MTCRCVSDMAMLILTGDISSVEWARLEFGATPFEDPSYFREISPLTYADEIRTPLLIQHSERDIRTTIGQAEALFTACGQPAAAGPAHARPGGDPRADPVRHAVPAGREPRGRARLVPPLPRRGQARPAAAPKIHGGR